MAIVGHHPETGVRIDVTRSHTSGPPWRYEGEAVMPNACFALAATVEKGGAVEVRLPPDAPLGLGEKARLLVRAAWRHAEAEEVPPPRRIVRWRPDR